MRVEGAYLELQQCICAVEAEGIEMLLSHLRDGAGVCDVGVGMLRYGVVSVMFETWN
jgi:hypothetical protein